MKKVKARSREDRSERGFQRRLLLGLGLLACLTPLGVLLPQVFHAGGAWGEWDPGCLEKALGYVPAGLMNTIHLWKPPLPGYAFSPQESSFVARLFSYLVSGFIGLSVAVGVLFAVGTIVRKHGR